MTTSSRRAPATILGLASFAALGWGGLLVPSLVPVIEADFAQTDAGVGVFFLATSAFVRPRLGRDRRPRRAPGPTARAGRRRLPDGRRGRHGRGGARLVAVHGGQRSVGPWSRRAGGGPERSLPRRLPRRSGPGAEPPPPLLQPGCPHRTPRRRAPGRGRAPVAGDVPHHERGGAGDRLWLRRHRAGIPTSRRIHPTARGRFGRVPPSAAAPGLGIALYVASELGVSSWLSGASTMAPSAWRR